MQVEFECGIRPRAGNGVDHRDGMFFRVDLHLQGVMQIALGGQRQESHPYQTHP